MLFGGIFFLRAEPSKAGNLPSGSLHETALTVPENHEHVICAFASGALIRAEREFPVLVWYALKS